MKKTIIDFINIATSLAIKEIDGFFNVNWYQLPTTLFCGQGVKLLRINVISFNSGLQSLQKIPYHLRDVSNSCGRFAGSAGSHDGPPLAADDARHPTSARREYLLHH